jgi:DNA-binding transcriptional LysR family regulator
MNLSQYQIVVSLAETRSFTRTAEKIAMTQSAVSHALNNLEAELGISLFERTRNGVLPTSIGEQIVLQAREILTHAEMIRQLASQARGITMGKIRLGTMPTISASWLPTILRQLQQDYPQIEVTLFEGIDDEVLEWVENGVIDLGFITFTSEHIDSVPLTQDEMVAIVPSDSALAQFSQLTPAQLNAENFILSRAGCARLVYDIYQRSNTTLKPRFEVGDLSTILAMVRDGLGVSIIPSLGVPKDLENLRVLSLNPVSYRDIMLGVRNVEKLTLTQRAVIETIQRVVQHYQPNIVAYTA